MTAQAIRTMFMLDFIVLIVFEIWRARALINLRFDAAYLASKRLEDENADLREENADLKKQLLEADRSSARHEVHAHVSDQYMERLTDYKKVTPQTYLRTATGQFLPTRPFVEADLDDLGNMDTDELIELYQRKKSQDEIKEKITKIRTAAESARGTVSVCQPLSTVGTGISRYQKQILAFELSILGFSKEEIAELLGINPDSVGAYRSNGKKNAVPVSCEETFSKYGEEEIKEVVYSPRWKNEEEKYITLFKEQYADAVNENNSDWLHRYYFDLLA